MSGSISHLVIVDRIQEKDLTILKVLIDKWKETHQGRLAFDAELTKLPAYATKIPKESFESPES